MGLGHANSEGGKGTITRGEGNRTLPWDNPRSSFQLTWGLVSKSLQLALPALGRAEFDPDWNHIDQHFRKIPNRLSLRDRGWCLLRHARKGGSVGTQKKRGEVRRVVNKL